MQLHVVGLVANCCAKCVPAAIFEASIKNSFVTTVSKGGLKESHIAECLHHLPIFYDIVANADFFMTEDESDAALHAMQRCLQHYVWLQAHVAQDCVFQLVPKFHWAYHLAQMCKYQNPKTFWTYRQESWVGSMALVAHSCSHGTKNTKLSESFCEKYLLGLQLRLNQS